MDYLKYIRHDRETYPFVAAYTTSDKQQHKCYYKYTEAETMVNDFNSYGKQELKLTCSIEVEGNPKLAVGDSVVLQNGHAFVIQTINPNYIQRNLLINDLCKQKVQSYNLELE